MATKTIVDYRRTDQRSTVLENPFWLTSGIVIGSVAEDKGALLFSFPKAGQIILIHEVVVQNIIAFTGSTTIAIGNGTLATNAITTDGDVTIVTADSYITTADDVLTEGAIWGPTTANTSTWLTAAAARTYATPRVLVGAATTVPCIYATLANAGTAISAGTMRVHVLVTILPGT